MKKGMDRLWAPWRVTYISKARKDKKPSCIFCDAAKGRKEFTLFTTPRSVALLNLYPYNNGHTMVAPRRHTGDLKSLSPEETLDLFAAVRRTLAVLDRLLKPEGYNIGLNLGRTAGAGIPGHLHVHIVPRWNGDTNFMPVTGATKVISQALDELQRKFIETDRKLKRK